MEKKLAKEGQSQEHSIQVNRLKLPGHFPGHDVLFAALAAVRIEELVARVGCVPIGQVVHGMGVWWLVRPDRRDRATVVTGRR